jgi:hypothetical protein
MNFKMEAIVISRNPFLETICSNKFWKNVICVFTLDLMLVTNEPLEVGM